MKKQEKINLLDNCGSKTIHFPTYVQYFKEENSTLYSVFLFLRTGFISQCRSLIRMECFHWCPPCLCITYTSCCPSLFTASSTSAQTWSHLKTYMASLVRVAACYSRSDQNKAGSTDTNQSYPPFFNVRTDAAIFNLNVQGLQYLLLPIMLCCLMLQTGSP